MTDELNNVKPGQPIKDKEALAKSNAEASEQAQKLAAEHKARDMAAQGHEKPVAQSVADSIKNKLEHEEFKAPEQE